MIKSLPVGVDDFEKLRTNDSYYVDKTLFIKELLDYKGEVNLFTRPRRFGKSLCLSMVKYFFENTGNEQRNKSRRQLFAGLGIMDQGERYTGQMCGYPVISVSLKSGKQPDFAMARDSLLDEIIKEYNRHDDIRKSGKLLDNEIARFESIQNRTADPVFYAKSLEFLSLCLAKCYGRKVLILIDEYDVPLENAYFCGFYEEMTGFIRSLFESALKTNVNLEFAVITGCLRITRESNFTGLNNLEMISILNDSYDEFFGFTQNEVDGMLSFYHCEEQGERIREWYDGYLFGNARVYNPWSVVNYVKALVRNPRAIPFPYWANTSSNNIIRRLIDRSDMTVRGEIESLIAGDTIEKPIREEVTYGEIDQSEDNLWSFLLFTGYLKLISQRMEGVSRMAVMGLPNVEVEYIYQNTVLSWFDEMIQKKDLTGLYRAVEQGDTKTISKEVSENLQETISFYDYGESYYHGFLAGLLKNMKKYRVVSNRETGRGRADLILKTPSVSGIAIVMELKAVKQYHQMEAGCEAALAQLEEKGYIRELQNEGYQNILAYGIAFYQKECLCRISTKIPHIVEKS